jgi:hypothetical protein
VAWSGIGCETSACATPGESPTTATAVARPTNHLLRSRIALPFLYWLVIWIDDRGAQTRSWAGYGSRMTR